MAVMTEELLGFLVEHTTAHAGPEAGIFADLLEEGGDPADNWLIALLRFLHESGLWWHTRPYRHPVAFDVNFDANNVRAIVREPVEGTTWAVVCFQVPLTGFRALWFTNPTSVWVRLPYGREGPMGPLASTTSTIMYLTTIGVPVLPNVPPDTARAGAADVSRRAGGQGRANTPTPARRPALASQGS